MFSKINISFFKKISISLINYVVEQLIQITG